MKSLTYKIICTLILVAGISIAQDQPLTIRNVDFAIIYMHEGLEYAADGNISDAKISFEKALSYHQCNIEIRFYLQLISNSDHADYLGWVWRIKKMPAEKAERMLDQIKNEVDDTFMQSFFSTLLFNKQNKFDEAIESITRTIAVAPEQAYLFYLRGNVLLALKKNLAAIADYSRALNLSSCSAAIYYQRGIAYYGQNDLSKAISDFQFAMTMAPYLRNTLHKSLVICEVYNQRGILNLQNGRYKEALGDFNTAISIHPKFSEPYLNRGTVYRNLNLYGNAIGDFNQAIILNEKYVEAYYNRALVFKEMNQVERAMSDLKIVVIMQPLHYQANYQMANILFKQEDFYAAIDAYTNCLNIAPEYVWAYYKRAQAYDRLRKYPGAIKDYNYFYAQAPDSFLNQKVNAWERSNLLQKWLDERK
jgi:tetratricopeptide (TPR) repeat protein